MAILHTTNAKLDYAAIADYMGPGTFLFQCMYSLILTRKECTLVAVRLHIQQLKRQVAEANGSVAATPSSQNMNPRKNKGLGQEGRKRKRSEMQQGEEMAPESPSEMVEGTKKSTEGEKSEVIKEEIKKALLD